MSDQISRRTFITSTTTPALAGLAGCVSSSRDHEESIDETIALEGATGLTVDGESGSVDVYDEDRDTIGITGRKQAASEDDLEATELDVDRSGDTIDLAVDDGTADGFFSLRPNPVVDIEIAVPESLHLESVSVGSGTIDVADLSGSIDATAGSGTIEIDGVDGPITTETGSGTQTLESVDGSFDVTAGSGTVTVALDSLEDDSRIEAGSGSVSLTLPEAVDAVLAIDTGSGESTVRGSGVDTVETSDDVERTLGDGTHRIDVSTGSGDVDVTVGE